MATLGFMSGLITTALAHSRETGSSSDDWSAQAFADLLGSMPGLSAVTDLQRLRDEWIR